MGWHAHWSPVEPPLLSFRDTEEALKMTDLKMANLQLHDMKMTDHMGGCQNDGAKVEVTS